MNKIVNALLSPSASAPKTKTPAKMTIHQAPVMEQVDPATEPLPNNFETYGQHALDIFNGLTREERNTLKFNDGAPSFNDLTAIQIKSMLVLHQKSITATKKKVRDTKAESAAQIKADKEVEPITPTFNDALTTEAIMKMNRTQLLATINFALPINEANEYIGASTKKLRECLFEYNREAERKTLALLALDEIASDPHASAVMESRMKAHDTASKIATKTIRKAEASNPIDQMIIDTKATAPVKATPPKGVYKMSHYNLPGLYCNVRLFIPATNSQYHAIGAIANGKSYKAVMIGMTPKSLYSPVDGNGKWWMGTLVELHADYAFFPKVLSPEPGELERYLYQEKIGLNFHVMSDAVRENIMVEAAVIKKAKREEFPISYHRPEDPEVLHRIALEKANATFATTTKKATKAGTTKEQKAPKEPKAVQVKAANVEVNESMSKQLPAIETVAQLEVLFKDLKSKKLGLYRISDGLLMEQFEKVPGKTDKDAIGYNTHTGKVRVCLIHRFWAIGKAK